jgi:glycerol-3-phosphate acyltransferase PlsY
MILVGVSVAAILMAYFVGGIPFGLLVTRLKGVDILNFGSGNIGAANVARALGRGWGIAVFGLDMLKGLVPCLVSKDVLGKAGELAGSEAATTNILWLCVGLAAVLGHNHSPFMKLRGGKGVSTSFGVALGIYPNFTYPALVGLVIWATMMVTTGMSALGSILAAISFPVAYCFLAWWRGASPLDAHEWPFLAFSILVSLMLLARHRANIGRLLSGTEAKFGRRKKEEKADSR